MISTPVHLDIPLTPVYADKHYVVTMDAAGFVPNTLEVVQDSVVQWTNNEATSGVWHTATSDLDARSDTGSAGWDSGLLNSDETYSRRFDTLGTFTYHYRTLSAKRGIWNPTGIGRYSFRECSSRFKPSWKRLKSQRSVRCPAFLLGAIGHLPSNRRQMGALAAHDAADEGGQRV